jgi:cell division protein FtsB
MIRCQFHRESEVAESALLQGERARYSLELFVQSLLLLFAVLHMRLRNLSARLRGDEESENALDRTIE